MSIFQEVIFPISSKTKRLSIIIDTWQKYENQVNTQLLIKFLYFKKRIVSAIYTLTFDTDR